MDLATVLKFAITLVSDSGLARLVATAAAQFITAIWGHRVVAAGARLDARKAVTRVHLAVIGRLVQMDQVVNITLVCMQQLANQVLLLV